MAGQPLRNVAQRTLNSEGRSFGHVAGGLALVGAALAASAALGRFSDPEFQAAHGTLDDPDDAPISAVWTPLFLALTVSGLRVWNAPPSARRSTALTLWTAVQGLNAAWMVMGPRRIGGGTAASLGATAVAMAYLRSVERLDHRAAALVSPFVSWRSFLTILLGTALSNNKAADPDKVRRR
jgi:tryptophan-rich sensory protein